ncbi:hypothetical protein R1sor_017856 [Riccia sorocarpa]|uniref:Uncharacterized protein n=1 Tax=Riccia sorocarpa TaxID=122646 RepID=A0ABD3I9V7_9MARC
MTGDMGRLMVGLGPGRSAGQTGVNRHTLNDRDLDATLKPVPENVPIASDCETLEGEKSRSSDSGEPICRVCKDEYAAKLKELDDLRKMVKVHQAELASHKKSSRNKGQVTKSKKTTRLFREEEVLNSSHSSEDPSEAGLSENEEPSDDEELVPPRAPAAKKQTTRKKRRT